MPTFDSIYEKFGIVQKEPEPFIVESIGILKKHKAETVLDAGCGTGRHTHLLMRNNFIVHASDKSPVAIRLLIDSLSSEELKKVRTYVSALEDLRLREQVDAVLVNSVLCHLGDKRKIKAALNNLKQLLKDRGFLIMSEISNKHARYKKGAEVTPGVFVFDDATEKDDWDQPHYFFSDGDIRELLEDFKIIKICHDTVELEPTREKNAKICVIARKP